jgi:hypothetical protein
MEAKVGGQMVKLEGRKKRTNIKGRKKMLYCQNIPICRCHDPIP